MENLIHIKEFFDTGTFGDTFGYGGGNGIFKVTYRPFKDLSVTQGPDPKVPRKINGAGFQVGDIVIGIPVDEEDKRVAGMITKVKRDPDNKGYRYFVQVSSKKLKDGEKVMELKPDTVEFVDMGNKGHQEVVGMYRVAGASDRATRAFNPETTYTSSELGVETVGG